MVWNRELQSALLFRVLRWIELERPVDLLVYEVCDEAHECNTIVLIVSLVHTTETYDGTLHNELTCLWKLCVHLK